MRRVGTAFFLGDTAFLSDPKFRALQRRLPDPDDFNSAVGAYWIGLAAARRNGTPTINLESETASRFLPDLCAVGLLADSGFIPASFEEWAPRSPQAIAGAARADKALRDEKGRMLPASPSVPSALESLDKLVQPSTPLPSTQIPKDEGGTGGDDLWRLYMGITRSTGISPAAMTWLEDLEGTYGVMAAAAMITDEHKRDKKVGTLLSRVSARLSTEATKREGAAVQVQRSNGIYERMVARRMEQYRYTGTWLDEWGDKPEAMA